MVISEHRENGMDNTRSFVPISAGTMISHYRIIEKIGAGGMGEVYLAEDTELNRKVALKFLPPHLCQDEDCRARFKREAQAAAKLSHPNIVTIYGVGDCNGRPYFAMEHIEGRALGDVIKKNELSISEIVDLAIEIFEGLNKAHQAGIVHRDVKPSNIVIDTDSRPKLLDFGLAAIRGSEKLTISGSTLGTIGYMSPEQIEGKDIDRRSDLFSLGVVFYEMIAGQAPFKGDSEAATLNSVLNDTPEPLSRYKSGVSDELQRIISKLLEQDTEFRYQSAVEVISDLKKLKIDLKSETSRGQPIVSKRQPSIAVLPFIDMSAQKDQEYFCDGMAEEIINALTHVESLRVVARTSAFSFKGKDIDISEIGRKLSVGTLLEGSVRKSGNRLRITAQLINVADGYHLWSEKYDRDMEDIFAIQDQISEAIASTLKMKLVERKRILPIRRRTIDVEAYNFYLKGLYFRRNLTEDDINKAIEYFNRAIETDPDYALAYAGLAYSYMVLAFYTPVSPTETYPKAREAALKALELDDQIAEVHESMAVVYGYFEWNWERAERECKKIIKLNPGYAWGYFHRGNVLSSLAKSDEAIEEMKKAHQLDPLNIAFNRNLGVFYLRAGQLQNAIEALQRTIEMDPTFPVSHLYLGYVYMQKSMNKEAVAEVQKETKLPKAFLVPQVGIVYARMGRREEAIHILNKYTELSVNEFESPYGLASLCFALGENDFGFQLLEKAYEAHDMWMMFIKVDFLMDSVRTDPRFNAMLRKMGLE